MIPSQRGAWGEAVAAAWLMERGYEVYQGIGNPSVDFIALQGGVTYRVEVKTAVRKPGKKPFVAGVVPDRFDMLLVVFAADDVVVNPTPDEVGGALGTLRPRKYPFDEDGRRLA